MKLKELIYMKYSVPGKDYESMARGLNEPQLVPNPQTSPAKVPVTVTLKALMAAVPAAEMVATYKELPTFVADLKAAIDDQDREYMAGLLQIAATAGVISAETVQALQALLAAEMDDPEWRAMVFGPSLAEEYGFGVVTGSDVQAALN